MRTVAALSENRKQTSATNSEIINTGYKDLVIMECVHEQNKSPRIHVYVQSTVTFTRRASTHQLPASIWTSLFVVVIKQTALQCSSEEREGGRE